MEELQVIQYTAMLMAAVVLGLRVTDNGSPLHLQVCRDNCPAPFAACSATDPTTYTYPNNHDYTCINVTNYPDPAGLRQGNCPWRYWLGNCPDTTTKGGLCNSLNVGPHTCYVLAPVVIILMDKKPTLSDRVMAYVELVILCAVYGCFLRELWLRRARP